jgi:hypothetical protein
MYNIIDSCYRQNFGLDDFPPDPEMISSVLKGQRQLDEWKNQLVPQLTLHIKSRPLTHQDLENLEPEDLIIERFNIVLSVRYHNLCILLHRPILEKFLDSCGTNGIRSGKDTSLLQQVGLSSIDTCVNSAMTIISAVHTVVMSDGWRRDLLGAWNYSLFYSMRASISLLLKIRSVANVDSF